MTALFKKREQKIQARSRVGRIDLKGKWHSYLFYNFSDSLRLIETNKVLILIDHRYSNHIYTDFILRSDIGGNSITSWFLLQFLTSIEACPTRFPECQT